MRLPNPRLLLVEGPDDGHVIRHLLAHHGFPERLIEIVAENGVESLLQSLPNWLIRSGLDRLGVVVDTDTLLAQRWQAIGDVLRRSGYTRIPAMPTPGGVVIEQASAPTVGVWLMPDNAAPGMIEDFVGSLIPRSDALWRRARRSVDTIPEGHRRFPAVHRSKACIHTWLAWQEQPGTPMGSAIRQRYLDADAPQARALIDWIRRLFPDASATPP